jgi:hypothetical protein
MEHKLYLSMLMLKKQIIDGIQLAKITELKSSYRDRWF